VGIGGRANSITGTRSSTATRQIYSTVRADQRDGRGQGSGGLGGSESTLDARGGGEVGRMKIG
jgi:hypothetical protein